MNEFSKEKDLNKGLTDRESAYKDYDGRTDEDLNVSPYDYYSIEAVKIA